MFPEQFKDNTGSLLKHIRIFSLEESSKYLNVARFANPPVVWTLQPLNSTVCLVCNTCALLLELKVSHQQISVWQVEGMKGRCLVADTNGWKTDGRAWGGVSNCRILQAVPLNCLKGETWEFVSLVWTDRIAPKQQPNSCRPSLTVTVTNPLIYRDETNQYNTQSKRTQTLQM